jgi:hypothetical protein
MEFTIRDRVARIVGAGLEVDGDDGGGVEASGGGGGKSPGVVASIAAAPWTMI